MNDYEKSSEMCKRFGYTLECWSPLEIRHEDGSFASLNCAEIMLDWMREQEGYENNLCRKSK